MIRPFSDNKTSSDPNVEDRRSLFENIFSLLEAQGIFAVKSQVYC